MKKFYLNRKVPDNLDNPDNGPMAHQVGEGDITSLHLLLHSDSREIERRLLGYKKYDADCEEDYNKTYG